MYEKASRLAATGADLIHLEVGMPSFDTPAHVKDATIAALHAGRVHYGDFR
jgi:aspartate aminotransferase